MIQKYWVLFPMVLVLTGCPTGSGSGGGIVGNILSGGTHTGGTSGPTGTTPTNPLPNQPTQPILTGPAGPASAGPSILGPEGGGQGATVDPSTGDSSSSEGDDKRMGDVADEKVGASTTIGGSGAAGAGTIQDTPITIVGNPAPFSPATGCTAEMACVPTFMSIEMSSTAVVDQKNILQTNLQGNVACINTAGETISRLTYRSVIIQDMLLPLEPLPPEGLGTLTGISSEGEFSAVITGPPSRRLRLRMERCDIVTTLEVETPSSAGALVAISDPVQQVEENRPPLQGGFTPPVPRGAIIPQLKNEKVLKKNFKK